MLPGLGWPPEEGLLGRALPSRLPIWVPLLPGRLPLLPLGRPVLLPLLGVVAWLLPLGEPELPGR